MVGTPDVMMNFESKTELNFRSPLMAKFTIPRAKSFWSSGFEATPKTALYPSNDHVEDLCREVSARVKQDAASVSNIGQLLVEWAELEEWLLPCARQLTERNASVRKAIRALVRSTPIEVKRALLVRSSSLRGACVHSSRETPFREDLRDLARG